MRRDSWAKYLEISTNIAVLVVAVVLLAAFISARFGQPRPPAFQRGIGKGDAMPSLPSVDYRAAPRTLLLALSAECGYCQDSLPFYRRLIDKQRKDGKNLAVVALFPDSETVVNEYKQRNSLEIRSVASVDPTTFRVTGTPTVILVDAQGNVSDVWVGRLSAVDEQQVMTALQH
ncbi:MAG TPA: hypothetical protein VFS90_01505 [Pyrinomonadaceae bacterium]|nr:hypothetical protein [Pyrinomonadaceae bacterium]